MAEMWYCSMCGNRIHFGSNEIEYVDWYDSCSEGVSKRIFLCKRCVKRNADCFEAKKRFVECNVCGSRIEVEDGKELKTGVWFLDGLGNRKINICKRCIDYFVNGLKEKEKKTSVVIERGRNEVKILLKEKYRIKEERAMRIMGDNWDELSEFCNYTFYGAIQKDWTSVGNWLVKREGNSIACYTPKEFERFYEIV